MDFEIEFAVNNVNCNSVGQFILACSHGASLQAIILDSLML